MRQLLGLLLLLLPGLSAGQSMDVVVSIKPVHSLVSGIMQGVAVPGLLLEGAESPHTYNMRPSDARLLENAELIVWVGPELEGFMRRPLKALAGGAQVLTLSKQQALELLPVRTGDNWEPEADSDHHHHDHHEDGYNTHLWLSPGNAVAIVEVVLDRLVQLDPDNRERYVENARSLTARLERLDAELAERLRPLRERRYVVFHDAYHYLEHRYGLNAVGSIALNPEVSPGARHVSELRRKLQRLEVRCVFREPQFESALVQTIIRGTDTRTAVLDPIGADLAAGPEAYFMLMRRMADALATCLD